MKTNLVIGSLKASGTDSLLDLLSHSLVDRTVYDPDFLSLVITELQGRTFTATQKEQLDALLEQFSQDTEQTSTQLQSEHSLFAFARAMEPRKYNSLKSLPGPLLFFGVVAIIFGVAAFIDNAGKDTVLNGCYTAALGIGVGVLLIAMCELIKAFVGTEYLYRNKPKA